MGAIFYTLLFNKDEIFNFVTSVFNYLLYFLQRLLKAFLSLSLQVFENKT